MTSFFRPEALSTHASADTALGPPLCASVPSIGRIAAFALALLVLLALMLGGVSYHQTAAVVGAVVPEGGEVRLPSPMSGTVSAVRVAQGDTVSAGDVLFDVTPEFLSSGASAARSSSADAIHSELAALRAAYELDLNNLQRGRGEYQQRIELLKADLDSLRAERRIATRQHVLAVTEGERAARSQQLGLISAQRLSEIQRATLDAAAAVQRIDRARRAAERERADSERMLAEIPLRHAAIDAALKGKEAALTMQLGNLGAQSLERITAPIDGIVFSVDVQLGQSVTSGDALARMAQAETRLLAELTAPVTAPGQIQVGAAVIVRAPSFPYQRFGHLNATVLSIAGMPSTSCPTQAQLAVPCGYRVLAELERDQVEIAGQLHRLRPGMRLEADIVLQRRRLWEWFAEPLLVARQHLREG